MRGGVQSMGGALAQLRSSLFSIQSLLAVGVGGFGVKSALEAADGYLSLKARLALVTQEGTKVESVLLGVAAAAQRARAPASELTDIYVRNAKALQELGRSQQDGIRLAETLAKITTISGATAQQASAGMMQLSQAIASGRFQGDEFRSVAENLPEIMRTLQRETGKSAGELRALAKEGKLTGEVLVNSLLNATDEVDAAFSKMPQTASQAFSLLKDAASRTFGKLAEDARLSETWAEAFNKIREAMGSAEFKQAANDAIAALKALGETLGDLSGYIAPVASGFSWLADTWREIRAVAEEQNRLTVEGIPALKERADAIRSQTDALAAWGKAAANLTGVNGGVEPLEATKGGAKLPITFGSGVDEDAAKRAAKLGEQLQRNLEIERLKYDLQRAEMSGDETLSAALKNQIEIRSRITDEMRKAQPELARQLESEILLSNELERQRELIEQNRQVGEQFGEALTGGIKQAIQEGKSFGETLKAIGARMFEIITEVTLLAPLTKGLGQSFSNALGGFDLSKIGSSTATSLPTLGFATGGVVTSPTRFASGGLAGGGLMGEAGPEAILPLRRGADGRLGVAAGGSGGGSTVVNIRVEGDATDATIEKMRRTAEAVFARGAPGLVRRSVDAVRTENVRNPAYLRR